MFEGFANVWTPVERAARLQKKPISVELAGERVALFRGGQGGVGALLDRCPHRGVALSLGKVASDGCLECPFHGWRFQTGGACATVPLNPDAKRERLFATALPVRERGGLIWVRTSLGADAPDEPQVPPELEARDHRRWFLVRDWSCHWTRAMENMLDSPHLPWVHRRTIGRQLRAQLRDDSKMDISVEDTPTGFRTHWAMDGRESGATLEFTRPNGMSLHIPIGGQRKLTLRVWCVPISAARTRMVVNSTRNFGRFNPLVRLFDEFSRIIVQEDQAIVESSQPPEVPEPAEERSVATDRATLRFRRFYFDVLRPSAVDSRKPSLRLAPSAEAVP
ncbi:MAG: aromatic ring-hydroxylating dioxygenase subunit alpha [Deltaproteobacteria bacterium]|nr:aromatic ring-hydroxylating dioxygenase subunit alpha [Deltaproteobacteria bacterium]